MNPSELENQISLIEEEIIQTDSVNWIHWFTEKIQLKKSHLFTKQILIRIYMIPRRKKNDMSLEWDEGE